MGANKQETNISEERYAEIKKTAYKYYQQYNLLPRCDRKSFLDSLPKLNTEEEDAILRCTLLFPDTEDLIGLDRARFFPSLLKMGKQDDNVTFKDVVFKSKEYSIYNTRELIRSKKLQTMDELSYPDQYISDKEYIETKVLALDVVSRFCELSLPEKAQIVTQACQTDTYQAKIQIATLLIPNDMLLMQQLENNSIEEIANYYKVPSSVIEFKMEEYDTQRTSMLINNGSFGEFKSVRVWHRESLDTSIIANLWDQSFYQGIENDAREKINNSLEGLFGKPVTKTMK
ncbi:MAG: hypothetical protein IJO43_04825 [Bacilli bacterium]|nr:hypothetical protein [Bacilli bacterium]